MADNIQSEGTKALAQAEHNRDANAKRVIIRAQDSVSGDFANISAVPNSDGTFSLSVTQSIQESNVYFALGLSNVNASGHRLLIDLSDTTTYPHDATGYINFSTVFMQVDRNATATGSITIGVITRVNATDADIVYFSGASFTKTEERHVLRDRNFAPSQLSTILSGGNAIKIATPKMTGITGVNTVTGLVDVFGVTKTPAVGDIVFSYSVTAGEYNTNVAGFYHAEP